MKQGPLHVNLHRKTLLLSVACALALSSPGAAGESGFLFDSLIFTPGAPPLPLDSPTLSSSELVVASPTELVVTYVTPDLEFPFDYRVGVSFPLEFGFGPAVTAEFSDNSPAPDPDLREIQIIDHTVIFRFRRTFFAPEAGQQGVITIRGVTLPTMARAFDAAVFITDRSYLVLAGPGFTNEITLLPAAPASITISPDTALSLQAGESQAFSALTVDQFANPIPDAAPDWSFDLQGDALGELTPGLLLATRAGLGKVTVSIGAIADTSGAIVVTAGALERIDLTLRSPQFSGGGTCGAAQLLMLDQFGNPKETFNGSGILLQLQVDNGTVSPASALVFGPFTNGIIDLSAVGSTGDGLVFSEFLGVTALRASIGNVQSAPVTFTIDGVEALPAPGQRFPASLPANSLLSYDLSLKAPAGTPGAVDSIRIENTSEGPRVFPGPFQLPGVVSAVSAISLNAGEDKLDLSAFASFTQPGVPGGACASTFTTHIPLTVNSDPLLATPGSDTLLTGVRYGSFVGFGFTSPHSVITILSAELQARDGLRWLSLGGLKTAPVPYQAAVDGKLEFTLDIPADTELAEGAHDLRIVATLTDGVFTYPDTALAPDRIVTLSPSSLIPQPGSLAPSIVAPQALQSFTGLFDASDPTRPVVYTGASLELFNAATTIGAAATVESASQLSVTSNPLNIPVELAETELGARFIINFIEFGVRRTDTLEFAAPAVTVGSLSPLTLSDVSLILPNSPRVNTNQEFTLSFDIINTSQIAVSDVIVGLVSTGASLFDREIIVGTMEPLEVRAISVPVVAAGTVNASETMTFTARSGAGGVTQSTRFATFTIQTPASIRLEAAVAPVSGSIAQIGRELSLEFRLVNEGEAEIELSQLVVSAQGARLNVSQTVDLTLEKRSLILGAPQTEASLLIRAILTKTPIDRNTGLPALITSPGADKFEQTLAVVASLARASASITLSKPAGILLGELRDLARLTLTNESSDQFATLEIESMRIFFRDPSGERLDPRDILALNQSLLVDDNGQVVSGRLAVDSALQVFFAPNSLSAGSTSAYNFVTRIDSAARIGAFVVSIPLDDIEIRVTGGLQSGQVFSPEAPSGAPSIFETTYILGAPAFAESFTPMNNPFNPSAGPNLYRYTLAADAGVELSVYTLTGDLVRRYSFASGAPGGTVGVQTVSWDGRNGDGLLVRNGVYLLQLVNLFTGEKVTLQQATLR